MSAETFTTAMFLITAVIAAGVLINAVFPVVYQMAGTFASSTHASDERLRTDFKIISTITRDGYPNYAEVWLKNIGSSRIPVSDITNRSDVLCGLVGEYERLSWANDDWDVALYDSSNPNYWDPGETIKITAYCPEIPDKGTDGTVYFQLTLPGGVWRSAEFTASK
ncbi:MAG: flagellin [Methanoregula sp.]|jgi:flagellar protein FlaG|uniref:flagellin n=1 Tax=Methanoregula sp. TaxID=2052170 RepID=UPI0025EC9266|nr:flagellin [Methanoregula sp.]MCK9632717.1 flagellin [Methanoregula sp.]